MANATAARSRAPKVTAATPAEIAAIKREIKDTVLVERDRELDVITLAALAAKNAHLHGPPGTAKSLGVREFSKRIGLPDEQVPYFEKTLHPQMPADALLGSYDMEKLLKESKLERKVEGYLPGASKVMLDEIGRANGPVTDALLPLMNTTERLYEANGRMVRAPILYMVTAANFLPDPNDPYLGAFVSRFTLMCRVEYIKSDESFKQMLRFSQARARGEQTAQAATFVPIEAFKAAQVEVRFVDATEDVFLEAYAQLRRTASSKGLVVDDRRWDELVHIARAAAWTAGRDVCRPEDLAWLEAGLWRLESEIPLAHELIRPFLSTFEKDAADKREEAQEAIDTHARLRPIVEGTPPTEMLDPAVASELSDTGRALHHVYQRVRESIEQAERQQSEATSLHELLAELEDWRQWRERFDLPARWDR